MPDLNQTVPAHLGIILDGNRRWAKARGLSAHAGHKAGMDTLKLIADATLSRGVKCLSVYAFSTENWSRSKEEVKFLLTFLEQIIKKEVKAFHKKGVRFIWLGSDDNLDNKLIKLLHDAENLTKENKVGTFCLCFNYGGQQEIVDAVNKAIENGQTINETTITENLYGGKDVPPIDFLIRTSGEHRLSNFMLWRAAYSELYFIDKNWPDFNMDDLDLALTDYTKRQRRFGG